MDEDKIKIENDTFALKREYKYALENLTYIKKDIADGITIKDKINIDIKNAKADLQDVLNKIAEEKVAWAQHRYAELTELENKESEVQNVLKRKGELNIQEETIRQETQKNQNILNETRTLEFKLEQDTTAHQVKISTLEEEEKKHIDNKIIFEKHKSAFKNQIAEVLKSIEAI